MKIKSVVQKLFLQMAQNFRSRQNRQYPLTHPQLSMAAEVGRAANFEYTH